MRVIQIVGYKNAGKTTLSCEIVRTLSAAGSRVGTLKHDSHDFEPDIPGKDTWQHRLAGACVTAITSPSRTAWVEEQSSTIEQLVCQMEAKSLDYLVIEGFKTASYPKVVLLRSEEDSALLSLPNVIAACYRETNARIETDAQARDIPLFLQPDVHSYDSLIKHLIPLFG
ncbi:molybdopterin-guanine dinucleotide biosynthesis protein B [Cohnella lupini]|uniref:Molybdopterin-guanine dinucleotide biosynthesis protein B n=1 Tax=Cohnella lupini TaxID=1294267 RepID=A0A3D9IUV1_9BACL|nr:molybdopterin-guanine dinucleotide biosynthesis protein B [Cohnella lupini]RED65583.1 molybdopterin-guanine dinucleotide biosynthesis protein B [Cohnella lupini]